MPPKDSRVAVTISCASHEALLRWWAAYTGRTVSSLVSFLLEDAIRLALRNGDVPARAVKTMNDLMDAASEQLADEFKEAKSLSAQSGSIVHGL
jgi:hypothetical protein